MTKRFQDKVFWITGGGSGIGQALAIAAAKEGAQVIVSGRRQAKLDAVVAKIESLGERGMSLVCDVTQSATLEQSVQAIVTHFGRLDIAVANAGFSVSGPVTMHSEDDWRRQLDTNVVGAAMTVRAAMPELMKTQGRVVLVGSVASMFTYPAGGAYCASKAALRAMGQALAIELLGTGVSATTVHPGFVESEIAQVDNSGRFDPTRRDPRPAKLMWTSERAAKVMLRAIYRRKREYTFTTHGVIATWIARHFPSLAFKLASTGIAANNARKLSELRNPEGSGSA